MTYASKFIIDLLLIAWIAGCEIGAAGVHTTSLPFLLWITHSITEDAVAARLVELTALLVAAAFCVLTLIAVVMGCEDALNWSVILSWSIGRKSRNGHLVVLSNHTIVVYEP